MSNKESELKVGDIVIITNPQSIWYGSEFGIPITGSVDQVSELFGRKEYRIVFPLFGEASESFLREDLELYDAQTD